MQYPPKSQQTWLERMGSVWYEPYGSHRFSSQSHHENDHRMRREAGPRTMPNRARTPMRMTSNLTDVQNVPCFMTGMKGERKLVSDGGMGTSWTKAREEEPTG